MNGNNKNSAIKTKIIKDSFLEDKKDKLSIVTESSEEGFEEILKIRKILKGYEELNKLYDICIEKIKKNSN